MPQALPQQTQDVVGRTLRSLRVLALLLGGMVLTSAVLNWQKDQAAFWVNHTARVLSVETDLLSTCQEIGSTSRGYALTLDPVFRERYQKAVDAVPGLVRNLSDLTSDNTVQRRNMDQLHPALDLFLKKRRALVATGEGKDTMEVRSPMARVRECLTTIVAEEERLLRQRQRTSARIGVLAWVALFGQVVGSLFLLMAVGNSVSGYKQESSIIIEKLEDARKISEEAREAAEAASTFKTQLVANVSHEIRTPLSSVVALAELISDAKELAPETRHMIDLLFEASKQLMSVLNELLDFGKLDAGRVNFEEVEFSVAEIARDVQSLSALVAQKKNISLSLTLGETVPPKLMGDPDKLRHVLFNLVNNAIKFTERGGVEISVEKRSDKLYISVADTGIGIPDGSQEKLFRPFVQVGGGTRRKYGGTGLGLAIAKGYVELMGGEIGFTSHEGAGSTFWFELPLNVVPAEPLAAAKQEYC